MEEEKNIKKPNKKHYYHRNHNNNKDNNASRDEAQNGHTQQKPNNPQNRRRNNYNKNRNKPENQDILKGNVTEAETAPVADNTPEEIYEPVAEYITEDTSEDENNAEATPTEPKKEKSPVMVEVVGIRFKSTGKTYYFAPSGITAKKGMSAIVETARGLEYGDISLANTLVSESDIVPPLRPIVRIATEADKAHNLENKQKEQEAFVTCNERILAHNLDMKLIDAQYTFDNSKLLFYFTSSGRVDFRELVKDLASVFRTRIELRQIGIRDEAKLIGGLGLCGRPLCCSRFLSDFGQVSIKMAKEQNLSLNSSKISGSCGRLMCCLRFEHETYEYETKRTPPVDSTVKTEDGIGTVTEINPLAGTLKVRLADKPDTAPKSYHRDNVTLISKK